MIPTHGHSIWQHIRWPSIWRSIWHLFWHSVWHSLPHSILHSMRHIFRHSIWHSILSESIWHIFLHSICPNDSNIHLAFYLTYIPTFYLAFFATFYILDILFAIDLPFFLPCVRVQVCPAASIARDRVRVYACPAASGVCDTARRRAGRSRGVENEMRRGRREGVREGRSEWGTPFAKISRPSPGRWGKTS